MLAIIVILGIVANTCVCNPPITYNDVECMLSGLGVGMIGSEDMALGKHGVLFITSGDLLTTFTLGSAAASAGGVWVLDTNTGGSVYPQRIHLGSLPEGRRFQGHGIDVSNTTDRVYTVTHNGDHSSVDIFQIDYKIECLLTRPWDCPPVSLTFIRSITSDIFPNYGINDVVEAEDNQIYVTQWQPFPFPVKGLYNSHSWVDSINAWSSYLVKLLGLKMTQVFRCSWTEDSNATCVAASEQRFLGANGLTIDRDRETVFVNDPEDKMITIMKRDKDSGKLSKESEILLPVYADNIEYDDESDEIIMGTIFDFEAVKKKFAGEDVPVPGGLSVARKKDDWEIDHILNHDGTKLSQISAGARFGDKVVLGSPFSEGILICFV